MNDQEIYREICKSRDVSDSILVQFDLHRDKVVKSEEERWERGKREFKHPRNI